MTVPDGTAVEGGPVRVHAEWRDAIKLAVTASPEPLGMFDIRDAVLGPPTSTDGRTRENRAWTRNTLAIIETALALWQEGSLVIVTAADGENPDTVTWARGADGELVP
jgi:hypothetical protein